MTLLADLGNLKDGVFSNGCLGVYGWRGELQRLSCEILSKISAACIEAQVSHFVDNLDCQQAHLAMGTAVGMGIANKAILFF